MADSTEPDIVRSVIAVMGGLLLYYIVSMALETVLVGSSSETRPTDTAMYFAIRNEPRVLAGVAGLGAVAAVLAGFVTARVAGQQELGHAGALAAAQTALLAWAFTGGEFASLTPVWARVVIAATTGPAMLLGATLRRRARLAHGAPKEPQ